MRRLDAALAETRKAKRCQASALQSRAAIGLRRLIAGLWAVSVGMCFADEATNGESRVVYIKPSSAAPGVSSSALAQQAWKAYENKQFDRVMLLTDECSKRFADRARSQQQSLKALPPSDKVFTYAALNDVATCLFIQGKYLHEMGRVTEAKGVFQDIVRDYRFAQCWDTHGWFWKVAGAAQDEINGIDYNVDFGNYTSETLTARAWKAYKAGRHSAVELYVRKCLELYSDAARKMQASLTMYPPHGQEFDYWALNDVATCLYIRGKSLQRQSRNKEAGLVYREIIERYSFAQCWDPSGWFWKIVDEAKRNLAFCS